jgi:hypothetical protein
MITDIDPVYSAELQHTIKKIAKALRKRAQNNAAHYGNAAATLSTLQDFRSQWKLRQLVKLGEEYRINHSEIKEELQEHFPTMGIIVTCYWHSDGSSIKVLTISIN